MSQAAEVRPRAYSPVPRVSLILPAFNEEAILSDVLDVVVAAFPEWEIIVVSDGCTDTTPAVATSYAPAVTCIHYQPNRGKGYAVRRGMLAARGRTLVFCDSDLPFGVDGIRQVVAEVDPEEPGPHTPDIAIACKLGIKRGIAYRIARRIARVGIALLTGLNHPDTQAGLKAFSRRAGHAVYSRTQVAGFASDVEVLYIARRYGLRVASVPLAVIGSYLRPSRFGLKQGARLLGDVGRIRLGRY